MKHTPFTDAAKEIEWQKNNMALGEPVDGECLMEIIEQLQRENDALRDKADDSKKLKKGAEDELEEAESRIGTLEEAVTKLVLYAKDVGKELIEETIAVKIGKRLIEAAERASKAIE